MRSSGASEDAAAAAAVLHSLHMTQTYRSVSRPMSRSRLPSRSGVSSGLLRCAERPRRLHKENTNSFPFGHKLVLHGIVQSNALASWQLRTRVAVGVGALEQRNRQGGSSTLQSTRGRQLHSRRWQQQLPAGCQNHPRLAGNSSGSGSGAHRFSLSADTEVPRMEPRFCGLRQ